jgi:hypothetical protein
MLWGQAMELPTLSNDITREMTITMARQLLRLRVRLH